MREYWMEALGTMFLVLVIAMTGNAFAVGAVLMLMMYVGSHISGGHYNPAVTLAVWMRGKIKQEQAFKYLTFQVLGGFVAALAYMLVTEKFFIPGYSATYSWWQAAGAELFFAFLLCYTYLVMTTSKKLEGNYLFGLTIGFALMVGVYATGSITNGLLNPAAALGPGILHLFARGWTGELLLYIVAPLLGGWLAAKAFEYFNPKD